MLYACVNEEFISNDLPSNGVAFGKNSVLTLDAAKAWFSENSLPVCEMRASDNTQGFLLRPSWNHAKEWKKGKYEVVETSLITQTSIVFYDNETSKKVNWKKDAKKIKNVGRMVFLKDLETGETRNFIMIIVGSYEYLMRKDNKLSRNNYLYREPKFDGDIFFYQPDGGLINGWRYKKGQITHKISPGNEDSSLPVLTRSTDCYFESFSYAYNVCPEMMNTAEFGAWVGDNDEGYIRPDVTIYGCSWQYDFITLLVCTEVDDGDDGYGYGNGGGGGVIPPGNTNPPAQTQTTYSATITGSTQIELLDNFYFTPTVTPAAAIVNVKYEISLANNMNNQKWILQEGAQPYCMFQSLKPGRWDVRATITLADTIITSNIVAVEVMFPDVFTVRDNPVVLNRMQSSWAETKTDANNSQGRREIGFHIYLNTSTKEFDFGQTCYGNRFDCQSKCTLEISSTNVAPSNSPLEGGRYVVATFHTHPPLSFCTSSPPRGTGASPGDLEYAGNIPGLLYDYVGAEEHNGFYIYAGHDVNDDAKIYNYGFTRRGI